MYLPPSIVFDAVYNMCPTKRVVVNRVLLPVTAVAPFATVMVPAGGTTPTFADRLELALVTVLIVVSAAQDLKQPVEKNSPHALSLDMRTDFNRGQLVNALTPSTFFAGGCVGCFGRIRQRNVPGVVAGWERVCERGALDHELSNGFGRSNAGTS